MSVNIEGQRDKEASMHLKILKILKSIRNQSQWRKLYYHAFLSLLTDELLCSELTENIIQETLN